MRSLTLKASVSWMLDESLVTRAAMGLVTTYQGMGDAQRAIAIYKHLT